MISIIYLEAILNSHNIFLLCILVGGKELQGRWAFFNYIKSKNTCCKKRLELWCLLHFTTIWIELHNKKVREKSGHCTGQEDHKFKCRFIRLYLVTSLIFFQSVLLRQHLPDKSSSKLWSCIQLGTYTRVYYFIQESNQQQTKKQ